MLEVLRRIVQEVDSAPSFQAALDVLVRSVREATGTEVCSVYLLDDRTERLVLMANEGFNPESVGVVSMTFDEGLVGLCASREEPINLQDAASHPRYRYFPETGEERYNAFLGVPIMYRRKVLGVLVVQQRETRRVDEGEVLAVARVGLKREAQVLRHHRAPHRRGHRRDRGGQASLRRRRLRRRRLFRLHAVVEEHVRAVGPVEALA
ncbi:MAG: GAF domain-containing protein, partial [Perlucidibaca sp.]